MRRLIITAVVALIAILTSAGASASCIAQPEDGRWINTDAATRSIPRIELRFICQDQILNGELYPPGPPWYVHVWGKCHPTNCDWGEVGATRISAGHVYAYYDQGFARRYVYAKMSLYRPGQLWVYTWTHFTDGSGRADYATQNWFRRE